MKNIRALLVEILDWNTGERAGGMTADDLRPNGRFFRGIDPYNTLSQSLDHEPKGDYELRLITDDSLEGLNDLLSCGGEVLLDDGSKVSSPLRSPADVPPDREVVNVKGVVVLEGEDTINRIADIAIPCKYRFAGGASEVKEVVEWCEKEGIKLQGRKKRIPGDKKDIPDILEEAYKAGCPLTMLLPVPHVREGRWCAEERVEERK